MVAGRDLLGFICKWNGFDLFSSPTASCASRANAENPERWADLPMIPQAAEMELELRFGPPSCKAQCNLKPEIPFSMSVHFPHVASELRGQVGAIRISTHVLLGWRQMTRLIPLAPLVPAAEAPRSPRTCAHFGRRGSSCRGRASGKTRGAHPPQRSGEDPAGRAFQS